MHAKFFHRLPATLHRYVDTFLNSSDSAHLAQTASDFHALSNKPPLPLSQRKLLNKFLGHVVRGEREPMQAMVQQNPQLLLQRDAVTDCSGRNFDAISGFEYALWALDKFQWEDMLACLPRDNTGHLTEESQKIVSQLQRHYIHVQAEGVTYRLNGVSKTESHYDFAIINALQEHIANQTATGAKNWTDIDRQWREGVGGVQRLCPMHVVDEYCSDTPFYPVPQFDSRPRSEAPIRQFDTYSSNFLESWFAAGSKLGFDFAICKGYTQGGRSGSIALVSAAAPRDTDLDAMRALCKTRTLDFNALEVQLESMMDVEEYPRAGF